MWPKLISCLLLIALSVAAPVSWGLEGEYNWGVSPYLGLFNPSLKQLNKGEFLSPYVGTADLIDPSGNNNNVSVPFIYRNPLPELSPGAIGGLEFQWRINERNALLMGGGQW